MRVRAAVSDGRATSPTATTGPGEEIFRTDGVRLKTVVNNQSGSSQRLTITRLHLKGVRVATRGNQTSHRGGITSESRGEITQRAVNGDDVDLHAGGTLGQPQDERAKQTAFDAPKPDAWAISENDYHLDEA